MNSPVKEMRYLEQFAALVTDSYGPGEWGRVEEVLRAVWPQTGFAMAYGKALAALAQAVAWGNQMTLRCAYLAPERKVAAVEARIAKAHH